MRALVAMVCGIVFGAGLAIAGMTNPAKVLAFLDASGAWDPTLAVVMGAALAVSAAGYAIAGRLDRPWLEATFSIPTRRDLDPALIGGAALFGVGWGLVGLCPGPALASLSRGQVEVVQFVLAMLVGIVGVRVFEHARSGAADSSPAGPLAGKS